MRRDFLTCVVVERGDQIVHQYALQAGGTDVEAEDRPLAAGDAVAAATDAARGEILLAVADGAVGDQFVEDLADRRDGEFAMAGQGGLARLLELVEQGQQHLFVVVADLLIVQAGVSHFTKPRLLYCVIFERKSLKTLF